MIRRRAPIIVIMAVCGLSLAPAAFAQGTSAGSDLGTAVEKTVEDALSSAAEGIAAGNEAMRLEAELDKLCIENPKHEKCVARREVEREEERRDMEQGMEAMEKALQNPTLGPAIRESMGLSPTAGASSSMAERKEYLSLIQEMCADPSSEACKLAKQDYEDWKAKQK